MGRGGLEPPRVAPRGPKPSRKIILHYCAMRNDREKALTCAQGGRNRSFQFDPPIRAITTCVLNAFKTTFAILRDSIARKDASKRPFRAKATSRCARFCVKERRFPRGFEGPIDRNARDGVKWSRVWNRDARKGAVAAKRRPSRPIAGCAPRTDAEERREERKTLDAAFFFFLIAICAIHSSRESHLFIHHSMR